MLQEAIFVSTTTIKFSNIVFRHICFYINFALPSLLSCPVHKFMRISHLKHLLYAGKRVKFGNYFFDRATNSGSAVVKNIRQS
jgi:hypothetical protein